VNYKVYQGTELKQTVTSKTAVMNGLQPNRTYEFGVEADKVQTVGGKTRYTHVAYANSSDDDRNMNNWILSDPAKQAAKITYKDGVNTIDYNGAASWEVFNFPVKAKKGQNFTFSFSWTQPDVKSLDGTANGAPVSIADAPLEYNQIGRNVINLGVSKTNSKLFTISDTATSDETYVSINLGYLADGIQWQFKASFQQDFSQDPDNHEYVGWYSDFTETDSNDPSQYAWCPVQDGDATRNGTKETISVTTRGIRFNIPKTLTVGSTVTLRYEEYPLGIVPIGNEPSGYFGGGNKQNLSAKVISTANGSSVVEVGGNVIDVGGKNLSSGTYQEYTMGFGIPNTTWKDGYAFETLPLSSDAGEILPQDNSHYYALTQGTSYTQTIWFETDATVKDLSAAQITWYTSVAHDLQPARIQKLGPNSYKVVSTYMWPGKSDNSVRLFDIEYLDHAFDLNTGTYLKFGKLKLEQGTIATPYAAFVDGDTFTAQPDGTCALFSEHKALYY
jgi:hypothetical protein